MVRGFGFFKAKVELWLLHGCISRSNNVDRGLLNIGMECSCIISLHFYKMDSFVFDGVIVRCMLRLWVLVRKGAWLGPGLGCGKL